MKREKMCYKFLKFEADRFCPLCNHADKVELSRRMQFGLDCTTVICKNCGFCFVSPPPTRDVYAAFYREAYASYYYKIHSEPVNTQPLRESHWNKARLDLIETFKPLKGANVLEIGPGRGRFLRLVVGRGAIACAIEPSAEFRRSLEHVGVEVIGNFLENCSTTRKFDLIMLFQVLEHFHDPVDAVCRIKQFLAPDGIIVLDVPNIWKPFRSLDRYFLRYVHLSYFSPQSLKRLFVSQAFEVLHVDEGGSSVTVPNALFAVFRESRHASCEADFLRDDCYRLLAFLKHYRMVYPCLYAPRVQLNRLRSFVRRGLSNSSVGDIYRRLKALRQGHIARW